MKLQRYDNCFSLPGFYKKRWVIQGTGLTYQRVNPRNYNVISINHACDLQPCFLAFLQDREAIQQVDIGNVKAQGIITRIINEDLLGDLPNVYGVEYDIDVEGKERYYPESDITPCQNSTSMAVKLLGEAGIKKVYTVGVDGGTGKAFGFPDYCENYDRHMKGVIHWAKHYNMIIVPVLKSRLW